MRITDEDALTPFDLAHAKRLWRTRLLRLADDDHVLSLVVHHIVSDGTSIDLWLDDIRATYVALQKGASVAERVSNALVLPSSATGARLAFWRDALKALPAIALPAPARAA